MSVTKKDGDDRNIQGKALERWERQKQVWDKMQRSLAKKVHKEEGETLQGSIHHFRMRQEELGMIDTSVPAEIKNGVSAWEMNLRAGVGGVRYVQIGSSYPYPLYCPIRDAESVKPDNHILMRVLPEQVPARHKPVSDTDYFQSRQTEFKKHIKKKFAHFTADQEPFTVTGGPVPLSQKPVREERDIEPVVFVPFKGKEPMGPGDVPPGAIPATPEGGAEAPPSRPLSAVTSVKAPATPPSAQEGPMLLFSSSHLSFSTTPGESAQGTLTVDNMGTTAVFYSWVPVNTDSVIAAAGGTSAASRTTNGANDKLFLLSDSLNGVMLPEDNKLFTFSFRAPVGGVYSAQYELLTVPAGKERIIVNLRGVVLADSGDIVQTAHLERGLRSEAPTVDLHNIFTEILTSVVDNVLDESNVRSAVKERLAEEEQKVIDADAEQRERRKNWKQQNSALGIPFNKAVYQKIVELHSRYQDFIAHVERKADVIREAQAAAAAVAPTPVLTGKGSKSTTPAPVPPTPTQEGKNTTRPNSAKSSIVGRPSSVAADVALVGETDLHTSTAQSTDDVTIVEHPKWGGCVRTLLEELSAVRDAQIRTTFLNALHSLLNAAKRATPDSVYETAASAVQAEDAAAAEGTVNSTTGGAAMANASDTSSSTNLALREAAAAAAAIAELPDGHECEDIPLTTLLMRSSSVYAFGEAADQMHAYSQTAKDMAEGKSLLTRAVGKDGKNDKGAKGAAAGKDKKGAPPGKGGAAAAAADKQPEGEDKTKSKEYDAYFFAGCKRIVGDAIEAMLTNFDNSSHAIATMCDQPLELLVDKRLDTIVEAHAVPDPDMETTLETNTKGKKK